MANPAARKDGPSSSSMGGVGDGLGEGEIHAIGFGCNYFRQIGRAASPRSPQHELPIPDDDAEDVTPTPYVRRNHDVVPTCVVECVSLPLFPAGVSGGGGGGGGGGAGAVVGGGRAGGGNRIKSSSFTKSAAAMGKVSSMFSAPAAVRRVGGPFKSTFGGGGGGSPSSAGGGGQGQQGDVAETSDETTTEEEEDAALASSATAAATATPVGGPPDAQLCCGTDIVRRVVCGATHTAVLSRSGDVYTMGTLHGNVTPKPTPCPIKLPLKCVSLAHGRRHVLALLEGGAVVLSWGAGHFGQLGHGGDVTFSAGPKVVERLLPQLIGGRVTTIAAGGLHSAALVDVGGGKTRAFAWGFNRRGQCGTEGGKCNTVPLPTPVIVPKKPAAPPPPVRLGGGGDASKDEEAQQLIGFGAAAFPADMAANPLGGGGGGHVRPSHPQAASEGEAVCFTQLALGRLHSVALSREGRVYCWGASSGGRCGLGEHHTHRSSSGMSGSTSSPQRVEALRDVRVVRIAAGDRHNLALTDGGHVYSWGMGSEGQLGHGHTMHLHTPRIIADLDFGAHQHARGPNRGGGGGAGGVVRGADGDVRRFGVTNIYASGCYSAALTGTGDIFTWGYGDAGNLGHVPLPRQNSENLPKVEPGPMSKTGAGLRIRDARSFDSRLNVLLPRRVTCTRRCGLRVVDAALGPVHMILLCEKRQLGECGDAAEDDAVPKTLYEIEIGRRSKGLARLRAMRSNRSVRGGRSSTDGGSADSASVSAMADAVVAERRNATEQGLEVERISSLTSLTAPEAKVGGGGADDGDGDANVGGNGEVSFGGKAGAPIAVPPTAPVSPTKGTEDEADKAQVPPDGVDDVQRTGDATDEVTRTSDQPRQGKTLKSKFSMFRIGGSKKKEKEKESSKGRMWGGKS